MRLGSIVSILVAAIALYGCGDSGVAPASDHEPTQAELEAIWQEAQPIIEEELAKEEARSAVQFPCTLYDKQAASDLLHAQLEAPSFAKEHKSGNGSGWQADACSWFSWGSGPSMSIWISRPAQFSGAGVQCFGIDEDNESEPMHVGRSSWFFQGAFAWSKLLVCRDDALFEIEIHDGPKDEDEARKLIERISSHIVESL